MQHSGILTCNFRYFYLTTNSNGRSTRIWLDLILKKNLKLCVDWSKINKKDYLTAMEKSVTNPTQLKALLQSSLTDKINDREMFMKGEIIPTIMNRKMKSLKGKCE